MADFNPGPAFPIDDRADTEVNVISSVLPDGASTSDNQTSGAQKTQIVNSSGVAAEVDDQNRLKVTIDATGIKMSPMVEGTAPWDNPAQGNPVQGGGVSYLFDGSALHNGVDTDGDASWVMLNAYGVAYSMLVSNNGSSTPIIDHSTVIGSGLGVATVMMGAEAKDRDGSALPNSVSEGDAVRLACSTSGVNYAMIVSEDGSKSPMVDEDSPISNGNGGTVGLMTMLESRTGQKTAMSASGDASRPVGDEYGQAVGSAFVWSTRKDGVTEANPISTHYLNQSLVDTTNVSAATHYYPSATGGSMDGYKDMSLTGKFIDADGTLTLTLEVTNDEDRLFTDTASVYFYDDELNATVATKTVTNGTELFELSVNNCNFRYYRWVVVASGATNTVILKNRLKAL